MLAVFLGLSRQKEVTNVATLRCYVAIYPLETDLTATNSCEMEKQQVITLFIEFMGQILIIKEFY